MATPGERPELPATAWTILGLLSFGRSLSGYDLKKWAENSLGFFYWSPAASQIYAELRRLERHRLATSKVARQDALRNKRVYTITAAGRAALRDWVGTAPEPTVLKHSLMLRVWLGHLSDGAELRELIRSHRGELEAQLDVARYAAERAAVETAWRYPAVVTRWAVRHLESEIALLDELATDVGRIGRKARRAAR